MDVVTTYDTATGNTKDRAARTARKASRLRVEASSKPMRSSRGYAAEADPAEPGTRRQPVRLPRRHEAPARSAEQKRYRISMRSGRTGPAPSVHRDDTRSAWRPRRRTGAHEPPRSA